MGVVKRGEGKGSGVVQRGKGSGKEGVLSDEKIDIRR